MNKKLTAAIAGVALAGAAAAGCGASSGGSPAPSNGSSPGTSAYSAGYHFAATVAADGGDTDGYLTGDPSNFCTTLIDVSSITTNDGPTVAVNQPSGNAADSAWLSGCQAWINANGS